MQSLLLLLLLAQISIIHAAITSLQYSKHITKPNLRVQNKQAPKQKSSLFLQNLFSIVSLDLLQHWKLLFSSPLSLSLSLSLKCLLALPNFFESLYKWDWQSLCCFWNKSDIKLAFLLLGSAKFLIFQCIFFFLHLLVQPIIISPNPFLLPTQHCFPFCRKWSGHWKTG